MDHLFDPEEELLEEQEMEYEVLVITYFMY